MAQQQTASRFNEEGLIADLVVRQDRSGRDWAAFTLRRVGAEPLKCVAFAEKADRLLASYGEGDAVRLFGFLKKGEFQTLWSGAPKADTPDLARAETAVADAYAALVDAQSAYASAPDADSHARLEHARAELARLATALPA